MDIEKISIVSKSNLKSKQKISEAVVKKFGVKAKDILFKAIQTDKTERFASYHQFKIAFEHALARKQFIEQ